MENIAKVCAKSPIACDYVYANVGRLAAQWLVEHQPYSANPVIRQINFKSKSYLDLVMALREAYAAGMVLGACLQADEYECSNFRI